MRSAVDLDPAGCDCRDCVPGDAQTPRSAAAAQLKRATAGHHRRRRCFFEGPGANAGAFSYARLRYSRVNATTKSRKAQCVCCDEVLISHVGSQTLTQHERVPSMSDVHVEERVGPHYDKAKMLEARRHTWHAIEKIAAGIR